jgi:hypothetical protein
MTFLTPPLDFDQSGHTQPSLRHNGSIYFDRFGYDAANRGEMSHRRRRRCWRAGIFGTGLILAGSCCGFACRNMRNKTFFYFSEKIIPAKFSSCRFVFLSDIEDRKHKTLIAYNFLTSDAYITSSASIVSVLISALHRATKRQYRPRIEKKSF